MNLPSFQDDAVEQEFYCGLVDIEFVSRSVIEDEVASDCPSNAEGFLFGWAITYNHS